MLIFFLKYCPEEKNKGSFRKKAIFGKCSGHFFKISATECPLSEEFYEDFTGTIPVQRFSCVNLKCSVLETYLWFYNKYKND